MFSHVKVLTFDRFSSISPEDVQSIISGKLALRYSGPQVHFYLNYFPSFFHLYRSPGIYFDDGVGERGKEGRMFDEKWREEVKRRWREGNMWTREGENKRRR